MPARHTSRATDYRDASRILRGLDERLSNIEEGQTLRTNAIQLSRQVSDGVLVGDNVVVTEQDAGSFIWDVSDWDRADWGDGSMVATNVTDFGEITDAMAAPLTAAETVGDTGTESGGGTGDSATGGSQTGG